MPTHAAIKVLSGAAAGREVPLVKVVTTIGKPGVAVAAITRRPHGFVVAHVDGTNKPTLNGTAVGAEPVPAEERRLARTGRNPDAVCAGLIALAGMRRRHEKTRLAGLMGLLTKHWSRIGVTLIPLVFALLHASGIMNIGVLQRLDDIIYDARAACDDAPDAGRAHRHRRSSTKRAWLKWGAGRGAATGWPIWSRSCSSARTRRCWVSTSCSPRPTTAPGLKRLRQLAQAELKDQPGFSEKLGQLQARTGLRRGLRQVAGKTPGGPGLLLHERPGRPHSGVLPAPVMDKESLHGRPIRFTSWNGYGANIEQLAGAAPMAGFFNPIVDGDGVVRSIPLMAEYKGRYYESLSLAMFRMLVGLPGVEPGFPRDRFLSRNYQGLESILLRQGQKSLAVPVDDRVAALVPFRGLGGAGSGTFRYISACDVLGKRLAAGSLKDKIVLVGTTAPGLQDLRVTPVGETYPGVETHANVISGLLDGRVLVKPDYAIGYEVVVVLLAGLTLAFALPLLSATRAVLASMAVLAAVLALNFWLYLGYGLVLPLAGGSGHGVRRLRA